MACVGLRFTLPKAVNPQRAALSTVARRTDSYTGKLGNGLIQSQAPSPSMMRRTAILGRTSPIRFQPGFQLTARSLSTASPFRIRPARPLLEISKQQQRTVFGSGTTRNLLAHLEEVANKNPASATAQNAFYQSLLKANMAAIVVERYQSGQFATNAACEAAYQKALASLGQADAGGLAQHGNLSNAQLQVLGQAIAASTRGGNIAKSTTHASGPNPGAKDTPIYVVVDESMGGIIFKWIRFLLGFGLVFYLCLTFLAIVIEGFSAFRKVGKKNEVNETKPEQQTARFSDVHGCDEAKDEVQEIVDFLRNPTKFSTLGGKLPKGVLLVGPPGTGKTLLARAVAGEAGVPFFYMSGSEFDEVYVGVGASRVRELFNAAKAKSPAIIFIDELDAIGGKRSARDAAYVKQTLNQLLTELDGFEQNSGIIIIGATNFPESLDKALTRPGRFDRHIVVDLPDWRGRLAILQHHVKNILTGPDVNLEALAMGTSGMSGAELANIINQAAVHASRAKASAVSMLDMEWAKDKVMMGAERRSMVLSPREKEMTAYHEAGHTLVGLYTTGALQLHKVTILPRGMTLGTTHYLPDADKYSQTTKEYLARIDVSMGGKAAEELVYGPDSVTSGCSGDISSATRLAYSMMTQLGMSEKLGNVDFAYRHENLSTHTRELIESEVRRTIEASSARAKKLLSDKRHELDLLAKALVDYETLTREEALKVIKGQKLEGRRKLPNNQMIVPLGSKSSNLPGLGDDSDGGQSAPPPVPPPPVPA